MKKSIVVSLILCSLAIGLGSYAQPVEQEKGYISVNESITKEIAPNMAEVSIGVETSDKSMQKASAENKDVANNVINAIKPLLSSSDEIKTTSYSAKPQYSYTKDNKKVFDQFVVKNVVVVKTKNTQIVSKLVDTAIAQGATNVENLKFTATDYESACNDVLSDLTKKAYAKANIVASSVNAKITAIKSINVSCSLDLNSHQFFDMAARPLAMGAPTPIECGKTKINVNVDASFYTK